MLTSPGVPQRDRPLDSSIDSNYYDQTDGEELQSGKFRIVDFAATLSTKNLKLTGFATHMLQNRRRGNSGSVRHASFAVASHTTDWAMMGGGVCDPPRVDGGRPV